MTKLRAGRSFTNRQQHRAVNTRCGKGVLWLIKVKAIKAGSLIDGKGGQPIKNGVILVGDDGRITNVGEAARVAIPSGSEVIEATGKTVIPGLFDAHCHMLMISQSLEKRLFVPNSL